MTGCSSEPVEFYVVANPSNPGEAPETFQMTLQDVRDDLGVSFSSCLLWPPPPFFFG